MIELFSFRYIQERVLCQPTTEIITRPCSQDIELV